MPQFHETQYGRKYFEHQLPALTRALEDIGEKMDSNRPLVLLTELATIVEDVLPLRDREDVMDEFDEAFDKLAGVMIKVRQFLCQ